MIRLISNLPALVKQYREKHKLTQKELAFRISEITGEYFDDTMVSKIENNLDASRIDLGTVHKLMQVIDTINYGNIFIQVD